LNSRDAHAGMVCLALARAGLVEALVPGCCGRWRGRLRGAAAGANAGTTG
jgi:hypothetical protein